MQRSLEQFEISPEGYFEQLDRTLAELRAGLASLDLRIGGVAGLAEELIRTRLVVSGCGPPPERWSYDVRLPNYLFDDVFEPEPMAGGGFKRWVGASGRIAASLCLPRRVQYDITIDVEDFASDTAAQSFYLRIDGVQYPWLSHAEKHYASLVLADDAAELLAFEIGVDPAGIAPERDTSFSFRAIDVVRRR